MTIKVEREALLRVISRDPSGPSSSCEGSISSQDEEFVVVDIPKPYFYDETVLCSTSFDDDSTCTLSTSSETLSDTLSTGSCERRVTFADCLVTDEWTRPFTSKDEVRKLFYSTEETNAFRQEYRLERKVFNDLSIDPDTFPVDHEELSNLVATSSCQQNRHRISRVVVLHNDKLETFFNPAEAKAAPVPKEDFSGNFFDNDSFWSGSLTWY